MLQDKSIEEILSSIKKKDLSVKEVIEHYLTQIKKFNPILNAIVSMKDEQNIIDEAIKMDNSKDKKGSLFGMPIAIKDLSDVENFPTTYGYINSKNNFRWTTVTITTAASRVLLLDIYQILYKLT